MRAVGIIFLSCLLSLWIGLTAVGAASSPSLSMQLSQQHDRRPVIIASKPSNRNRGTTSDQIHSLQDFHTRDSRIGFIRKVYAIFSSQMLVTTLITYHLLTNAAAASYVRLNADAVGLTAFLGTMATLLPLNYLSRSYPWNFLLLGLFTVFQSLSVGTAAVFMDPATVCMGAMYTLTVLAGITLYSFQPNPAMDLTTAGTGLLAAMISGLVGLFFARVLGYSVDTVLVSGLFAVLWAMWIAVDTQQIIGGKKAKRKFSSKDYIPAAVSLYVDVIGLLMDLLRMLKRMDEDKMKSSRK